MCVAAGYNEGCHVTTAYTTQGPIQMANPFDQEVKVYTDGKRVAADARAQAIRGLFVHTMVAHHGPRGEELVVVYRKVEK